MRRLYSPDGVYVNTIPGIHRTVIRRCNFPMDIQDIRRDVLKAVIKRSFNNVARQLALKVGRQDGQINDILKGRKAFGEKAARMFEDKLDLTTGYLDDIRNADLPSNVQRHVAEQVTANYDVDGPIGEVIAIMAELGYDKQIEILGAARYISGQTSQQNPTLRVSQ